VEGVHDLVPFVHVEDPRRSADFYARLGFELADSLVVEGRLVWAFLECDRARLMLAAADGPDDRERQAILFYLYARDLPALRRQLLADGVAAGEIGHPEHMPQGELRVDDPDGYTLLIGQLAGVP
jgi:catechol 2,3-dioxygenase-like lactoylglutathione lyase family enzyme